LKFKFSAIHVWLPIFTELYVCPSLVSIHEIFTKPPPLELELELGRLLELWTTGAMELEHERGAAAVELELERLLELETTGQDETCVPLAEAQIFCGSSRQFAPTTQSTFGIEDDELASKAALLLLLEAGQDGT
jgi:hypothetical protein